ncbi:MAG: hypothetical protein ABWZ27_06730 [Aestuariivirgaceae bacterium]
MLAWQRFVLAAILAWALLMIVPDLWRVGQPLGSFGFYADSDGRIYDVTGPFENSSHSPAARAGIRIGDRLELSRMRCIPYEARTCGDLLAVVGGMQFVLPGRSASIALAATPETPARQVTVTAEQRSTNLLTRGILILSQLAGIAVVLAAAWLVWTRPGPMSWGFFLYIVWFNPGQAYLFYALLQQWPSLLLLQNFVGSIAEAAGYAGFLVFALRVPDDRLDPQWQPVERAVPFVAIAMALALLSSYAYVLGYRTELITRVSISAGFIVDLAALAILMLRRRKQTPQNQQRLNWVIWGCLIGLPAYILAELGSVTTVFQTPFGDFTPTEDILGMLYLVNGVLCLFVFEAVRRKRVVNVAIPLRRVTILGLALSIPALVLHHQIDRIEELFELPSWAWLVVGTVALFVISRLHELGVEIADHFFNRQLEQATHALEDALFKARDASDVERLLAEEPFRRLSLTSAAVLRKSDGTFKAEGPAHGWDSSPTRTLSSDDPLLGPVAKGEPFGIAERSSSRDPLPSGSDRPIFAVPIANPVRCYALALYGPHASGADLDINERDMLARLGKNAAAVLAELENGELRRRVDRLESELAGRREAVRQ